MRQSLGKDEESHLGGGGSPDLEVVGTHEDIGKTGTCKKIGESALYTKLGGRERGQTHHANDPLVKVLGFVGRASPDLGSINHALDTLDLILHGQHRDVVLQGRWSAPHKQATFEETAPVLLLGSYLVGVGDPGVLGANVRDTLVLVPVIGLGEGLVDHVVKVAEGSASPRQLVLRVVGDLWTRLTGSGRR